MRDATLIRTEHPSPRPQHRIDQRRPAGLDLGDGAGERGGDVLGLLDRAFRAPAAALCDAGEVGRRPVDVLGARSTGVPRCSARRIWCSQSF
jgi:hypothetical protein